MGEDPRVTKTRGELRRALLDLTDEMDPARITVKMVLERSGVSRNAFYRHYRDVYDLMQECFLLWSEYFPNPYEFVPGVRNERAVIETSLENGATFLDCSAQHPRFFLFAMDRMLFSSYFDKMFQAFIDGIVRILDDADPGTGTTAVQPKDIAYYTFMGFLGVQRRWLASGALEPAEEVVRTIGMLNFSSYNLRFVDPPFPNYVSIIRSWHRDALVERPGATRA